MEPARIPAVATLRTLIALHQNEEKRLLAVLADAVPMEVRLMALFDLDKLHRQIKTQSEELARLEVEE